MLRLLVELQKQLVLVLAELKLGELLRPRQKRKLELLRFEPALELGLLQELRPLELMRLPRLEVLLLRLVIELQKQLEVELGLELKLVKLQVVELLRQA